MLSYFSGLSYITLLGFATANTSFPDQSDKAPLDIPKSEYACLNLPLGHETFLALLDETIITDITLAREVFLNKKFCPPNHVLKNLVACGNSEPLNAFMRRIPLEPDGNDLIIQMVRSLHKKSEAATFLSSITKNAPTLKFMLNNDYKPKKDHYHKKAYPNNESLDLLLICSYKACNNNKKDENHILDQLMEAEFTLSREADPSVEISQKQITSLLSQSKFFSPTKKHLQDNPEELLRGLHSLGTLVGFKQAYSFFEQVLTEEKTLNEQGFYTFFHGQQWGHHLTEKLHTDLKALRQHKERPKTYLCPHVRTEKDASHDGESETSSINTLDEKTISRKSIIKQGVPERLSKERGALFFASNSLFDCFTNSSTPYEGAFWFLLWNNNINQDMQTKITDLLKYHGLESWAIEHHQEIEELKQLHKKSETVGNLLLVAIPKKIVNDYCYVAQPCGAKRTIEKEGARNTQDFLDQLRSESPNKNFHDAQYCIVMLDKAMDPNGGFIIKNFHCAKPDAYKDFEQAYEKFIEKLKEQIALMPPLTDTKAEEENAPNKWLPLGTSLLTNKNILAFTLILAVIAYLAHNSNTEKEYNNTLNPTAA